MARFVPCTKIPKISFGAFLTKRPKQTPQPSPDGRWIAFISDQDGWDHLYVMPASGGKEVQITKGRFEAWRPSWSHNSRRIAFDAHEPNGPDDRQIGIATSGNDPARATFQYITTGRGTNLAPDWSPDDRYLVYQHTDPHNSADLFVISARYDVFCCGVEPRMLEVKLRVRRQKSRELPALTSAF